MGVFLLPSHWRLLNLKNRFPFSDSEKLLISIVSYSFLWEILPFIFLAHLNSHTRFMTQKKSFSTNFRDEKFNSFSVGDSKTQSFAWYAEYALKYSECSRSVGGTTSIEVGTVWKLICCIHSIFKFNFSWHLSEHRVSVTKHCMNDLISKLSDFRMTRIKFQITE